MKISQTGALIAAALIFSACHAEPEPAELDIQFPTLSVTETQIEHEPIGEATLHQEDGTLHVTGVTGLSDGVRSLTPTQAPGWETGVALSDQASAIQIVPVSSALPSSGIPASLTLARIDENRWAADPVFPSQTYRIDVYRSSELVGSVSPAIGNITLTLKPRKIKWKKWRDWKFWRRTPKFLTGSKLNGGQLEQLCSISIGADSPELTVTQGETSYQGDELEFIEEESHEPYDGVDSIELRSDADFSLSNEAFLFEE